MEEQELDPYEKQLLAEFESCDQDQLGSLDCNGLQQLCEKLQLDDHGQELMEYILGSTLTSHNKRITFQEFRDGLLAFLSETQNEMQIAKEITGRGSPDREVSPKFVFGKKKYGRRSRPESSEFDDQDDVFEDSDLELVVSIDGEHKEIFMRSRREGSEENFLPEKTMNIENKTTVEHDHSLLPAEVGARSSGLEQGPAQLGQSEEEALRAAWERLGVGRDGFLDRGELTLVCQAVGMEKVAGEIVRQLFEKLNVESNGRISFEEFLLLLRGGESRPHAVSNGETVSAPSNSNRIKQYREHSNDPKQRESLSVTVESDPKLLDLSVVSADAIVEMWEAVQVPGASRLLQDLGFSDASQVSLSELSAVLDEELRHLGTERRNEGLASLCSPQEMLLQAMLCLYQAEVRCLKSSVEHMTAERDKLRADILDANERASLLAQEVDDHHARLEESSQLQFKMLEQRHAQLTKELTEQLAFEREQLALQNAALEKQLAHLQEEDAHLRTELTVSQSENESLERENQKLLEQLQDSRCQLQKHVESLEGMQHWVSELEGRQQQEHVLPLVEKVQELEAENVQLRDQCDELTSKCETLAARLLACKTRKSVGVQTYSDGDPGEGGGTKRRGGSPGELRACMAAGDVEGANPRVSKIRRCSGGAATAEFGSTSSMQLQSVSDVAIMSASRAMEDIHLQCAGNSGSITAKNDDNDAKEVEVLRFRIAFLEQQLERMNYASAVHVREEPSHQVVGGQLKQVFEIIRQQVLRELQEDSDFISSVPQGSQRRDVNELIVRKINNGDNLDAKDVTVLECHRRVNVMSVSEQDEAEFEGDASPEESFVSDSSARGHHTGAGPERDRVVIGNVKCIHGCPQTVVLGSEMSASGGGADTLDGLVQVSGGEERDVELLRRCEELERSLELLRMEYEKCEDYWAGKLDEERRLYEQEQAASDDKFAELLGKVSEYEEMFGQQDDRSEDSDDRLSTIEERASLEKQVTDLEEECEELRQRAERDSCRRSEELSQLRSQLQVLQQHRSPESKRDVSVQVSDLENCSWERNSTFVVELDGATKLCLDAEDGGSERGPKDVVNGLGSRSSSEGDLEHLRELHHQLSEECHALLRRKDTLAHEIMMLEHTSLSYATKGPKVRGQACQVDLSVLHALNGRLHRQEQQCRQLQMSLKKRQQHSDALFKRTWQQHKEEVSGLRAALQTAQQKHQEETQKLTERLMQGDVLVRDLYVENAYLAANVQRLEQRCQVFVQMSADSSSV